MLESLIDLNIDEIMKNNKATFRANECYFSSTNTADILPILAHFSALPLNEC